ncbi:hypothetical protein ES703_82704 [subsurface metagenome]
MAFSGSLLLRCEAHHLHHWLQVSIDKVAIFVKDWLPVTANHRVGDHREARVARAARRWLHFYYYRFTRFMLLQFARLWIQEICLTRLLDHLFDNYRLTSLELMDIALIIDVRPRRGRSTTASTFSQHINYVDHIFDSEWLVRVESSHRLSKILQPPSATPNLRLGHCSPLGSNELKSLSKGELAQPSADSVDIIPLNHIVQTFLDSFLIPNCFHALFFHALFFHDLFSGRYWV